MPRFRADGVRLFGIVRSSQVSELVVSDRLSDNFPTVDLQTDHLRDRAHIEPLFLSGENEKAEMERATLKAKSPAEGRAFEHERGLL